MGHETRLFPLTYPPAMAGAVAADPPAAAEDFSRHALFAATAARALASPPLATLPASADTGTAVAMTACRISATVAAGAHAAGLARRQAR